MSRCCSSSSSIIHSVHFYRQDEALIQRLTNITTSAISTGNSVLIVATRAHWNRLCGALKLRNGDLSALFVTGRLTFREAQKLLDRFMVGGWPDAEKFSSTVGRLIARARGAAWNTRQGLTIFGEMVAILYQQGNALAALQLETLWNQLLDEQAFHLHCAYPAALFSGHGEKLRAICGCHSHVVGYAGTANPIRPMQGGFRQLGASEPAR
jgi:hypothetical protein